jgi:CheY-like chemotaxis protein/signal transduction histidine kinase/HAMP domain-containing protein
MDLTRFSLRTRLLAGFLSTAALTAVLVVLALYQIHRMAGLTVNMHEHPLQVGYAIRDTRGYVWNISTLLTRADENYTPAQIDNMEDKIASLERQAMERIALLKERYLGDQADVAAIKERLEAWRTLRAEKILYLRQNTWLEHERDYTVKANRFADDLVDRCQVVADFAAGKAKFFADDAVEQERVGLVITLAVGCLLILCKVLVGLTITSSVISPLGVMVGRLRGIAHGDFRQDLDIRRGDEIGALADSFREMRRSLMDKSATAEAVAAGDLERDPQPSSPGDILGASLLRMTQALRQAAAESRRKDWHKTGINELAARTSGLRQTGALAQTALDFLAGYLDAKVGAFYAATEEGRFMLAGSHALMSGYAAPESLLPGDGVAGQAARQGKLLSVTDLPEGYLPVASSLGSTAPRNVVAVPLVHEGEVRGVMELGALHVLDEDHVAFLEAAGRLVAVAAAGIQHHARLERLLAKSREQADMLQEQQEALRVANEELEEQAQVLRTSEEELKQQQEEMQVINEELEEKNLFLERQEAVVAERNTELEKAGEALSRKAEELARASRYKSEFLANMSHELRTPLNSLLILSRNLADNSKGNLTPDQVESAEVIHQGGTDLLELINDILDLSRIEAGKVAIHLARTRLDELTANLSRHFDPMAKDKGLDLAIDVDPDAPRMLVTDGLRLEQILRNLLSNAIKFTERGSVRLRVFTPAPGQVPPVIGERPAVAFEVTDTGIGIPPEKQAQIFEAFQQADGSITRRFGGAGLGLSISRELAALLGGAMQLTSSPGQGSVFTLFAPVESPDLREAAAEAGEVGTAAQPIPASPGRAAATAPEPRPFLPPPSLASGARPGEAPHLPKGWDSSVMDDRAELTGDDKAILIIEDDETFARILRDLCRDKGFKALVSPSGLGGLELARTCGPAAVILDLKLPDTDGWEVMHQLKTGPATRHIPVHIISAQEAGLDALRQGAIGFLTKPVSRGDLDVAFGRIESVLAKKIKELLVVEDSPVMRRSIVELVSDQDVHAVEASSGEEALAAMRERSFDCVVLDLGLPDMSGFELLRRLEDEPDVGIPPVVVYTGRDLTREEEMELRRYSESIIVKGARSEERLLDEATLFLHSMVGKLPRSKQRMLRSLRDPNAALEGKSVLVVDDDMRNLFAVSRLLEDKGMTVIKAENGEKALEALDGNPETDLVLLDIMMPVMDGYETLRRLRAQPRFSGLPVIALTAKAMKEDREHCLAAGASDYLPKPVDVERLYSVLRVWLSRS